MGVIYKYTNKINGKIYIGQTIDEERRYKEHKYCVGNSPFHRAIRKYKFENFDYEVLYRSDNLQDLNSKEIYYISLYKSTNKLFGYNIEEGGNNSRVAESTKIKISNTMKGTNVGPLNPMYGKHLSQETIDKRAKKMRGPLNPMYGKHLSEEAKIKISKANKGKVSPNKGKKISNEVKSKISKTLSKNLFEYNNEIYTSSELAKKINCSRVTLNKYSLKGNKEFEVKGHKIKLVTDGNNQ